MLVQLAAQKKKAVIAACLIAIMFFMWIKVLTRQSPQSAQAAPTTPNGQMGSQSMVSEAEPLKVSFVDLPHVAGRNDVIIRDFFNVNGWQEFIGDKEGNRLSGVKDVNVTSADGSREAGRKVAEKLKLEAIVMGKNPQVFINGKLLSQGDKLLISDGATTYECEVAGIEENTVFIRCGKAQITLKLAQAINANQ